MTPRRDRDQSTVGWVVAKCLLLGAVIALGVSAYLAFSPLRNPEVQECGSSFSFIVGNKRDLPVDFARFSQGDALRLAQQPTCRERALPRLQESMIGFGAFVLLSLLGASVGLIDDRVAYWRSPRFETLLAERPSAATGRLRAAPQLKREAIGRALPVVDTWDVGILAVLGIGGAGALVVFTGAEPASDVLAQVDWRGIVAAAVLVIAGFLVAAGQLVASSRRPIPPKEAVEVGMASAFLGPLQPSLGPLGLDAHYLTKVTRNRGHAIADLRARQSLGIIASIGIGAVVLFQAQIASLPTPVWPAFWYLPLGWCALALMIGGVRAVDRISRLAVRPGWQAVKDSAQLARDVPRFGVAVVGALAMPLIEIAAFVAVGVAVHVGVEFARLAAVWVGVRALSVVSPLNRGVGFVEPLATLGLLAAGVPVPYAVVTVLLHRALTLWLPMIPGATAFRRLRKAERL